MNSPAGTTPSFSVELNAAIERHRLYLAKSVLGIRVIGGALWLTLALVFGLGLDSASYRPQIPYVASYLIMGIAISALYRKFSSIGFPSTLLLAFVDLPFVFGMQYLAATGNGDHTRALGTAVSLVLVVLLIAILTLHRRTIAAVTLTGLFSVACTQALMGMGSAIIFSDAMLIFFAGIIGMATVNFQLRLIYKVHFEEQSRTRLARYFSPAVAAQIATQGTDSRRCHITVLVADIRGFTKLAEAMDPSQVVTLLNEYFQAMVTIIFEHGGTLDKFMGDGILAYFGGHDEEENSASAAVGCSIAMLNRLAELNTLRSSRDEPEFAVGIGVHSGLAVLGDVGSTERRDYTVIGDTVNLTARIEELTKAEDSPILVSEDTRSHCSESFHWHTVAKVSIRGREKPVVLFRPTVDIHRETKPRPNK